MSTKKIEEALKMLGDIGDDAGCYNAAQSAMADGLTELEAIRKACRDFESGTECGEALTSDAATAADLFEAIAKESK